MDDMAWKAEKIRAEGAVVSLIGQGNYILEAYCEEIRPGVYSYGHYVYSPTAYGKELIGFVPFGDKFNPLSLHEARKVLQNRNKPL